MGAIDLKSNIQMTVLHVKAQKTATATIVGTTVNAFHGAMFCVDIGAHTADDLEVTFQHRDGSDAWVDIPAADLDGSNDIAIVAGNASSQVYVGYKGNKEQIGALITDTGTGDAVLGIYAIKGFSKDIPVN